MFPEALLLHYMDDLDSKMESMRAHFEREAELESPWTSYNASLGRPLLNTAKFLAPKGEPQPEAAQSVPVDLSVVQTETLNLSGLEDSETSEAVAAVVVPPEDKL
jgi:3'-5' exoribonuclease